MIEPCDNCQVLARAGGLPCNHRVNFDMLVQNMMNAPTWVLKSCPHYKPKNNPADLLEWVK